MGRLFLSLFFFLPQAACRWRPLLPEQPLWSDFLFFFFLFCYDVQRRAALSPSQLAQLDSGLLSLLLSESSPFFLFSVFVVSPYIHIQASNMRNIFPRARSAQASTCTCADVAVTDVDDLERKLLSMRVSNEQRNNCRHRAGRPRVSPSTRASVLRLSCRHFEFLL